MGSAALIKSKVKGLSLAELAEGTEKSIYFSAALIKPKVKTLFLAECAEDTEKLDWSAALIKP